MNDVLGFTALILGCTVVAWIASRNQHVAPFLWTAFLIRSLAVVLGVYFIALPGQAKDATNFELTAEAWARLGSKYLFDNFHTGSALYSWLLSVIYILSDVSAFLAAEINALFGALVAWNVYRIVMELTEQPRFAVRAGWAVALFPTLVVFSVQTLREVAVIYPCTLAAYYLARWLKTQSLNYFLIAVFFFGCSAAFHSGMMAAIGGLVVVTGLRWLTALARQSGGQWARLSIAVLTLALVISTVIGTGVGLEKFGAIKDFRTDEVGTRQLRLAEGRAAYLPTQQARNPSDIARQLPQRILYFLFAPFPWMITAGRDLIGVADALLYVLLCYVIIRNSRSLLQDPITRAFIIIVVFTVVTFSLGTSNYGTALRHRAKVAPLLVTLAAVGLSRRRRRDVASSSPPPLPTISARFASMPLEI